MPFKNIKVIEFAGLAPGPYCGMILKDFGASVTRIDKVGQITSLDVLGNGKRSIAVNLKRPKGIEIIQKLCKTADVLLEPFRPGVMESLGLGPEILCAENPRLIYARLTGYGQNGKYSARAGHDINYVGLSGILNFLGRKNEKPTPPINLLADFAGGGLICALGITMALLERTKSGMGQIIDSNMVEGAAYVGAWLTRSQNLPIWGKERGDNVLDTGCHFYDTYETKDGKYMAVGAIEPQFYNLLLDKLNMTHEELPQFSNFEENKEKMTQIFLQKSQNEWCQIFDDVDACVTPILSAYDVAQHEHNADRKSFITNTKDCPLPVVKPAPILSRTPGTSSILREAPDCGRHTKEILLELNYSNNDIKELSRNGVVAILEKSKL